jgi:hypothetical protein
MIIGNNLDRTVVQEAAARPENALLWHTSLFMRVDNC